MKNMKLLDCLTFHNMNPDRRGDEIRYRTRVVPAVDGAGLEEGINSGIQI